MIGYLKGIIKHKDSNNLIIDIHDVGYEVFVPGFVFLNSQINKPIELFIYTHVRDEEISLFGFTNHQDKQVFLQLISVSGIGPRTALNIISYAQGSAKIIQAIQNADVDFFTAVKRVGKKSGQRIIIDLKTKIGSNKDLEFETEADQDLIAALKHLGFDQQEIRKAIRSVDEKLTLPAKISSALKIISK